MRVSRGSSQRVEMGAWQLHEEMIGLRITWIHYPQIRIFSRAPRGHIRDLIAARRPRSCKVPRLAVRQQRYVARGNVIAIQLIPFAAANILRKKNVVAAVRMKPPAPDGVRKKRQLLPLPAWRFHEMKLRRFCEPRGNQHLSPHRMPIRQTGASLRPD